MNKIRINNIIIGKQFEENSNLDEFNKIVKEKNIKVIVVQEGTSIKIEKNIFIDILWPNVNKKIDNNLINNNALVFKLIYNKFSVLFTGDIEEEAEKVLIDHYRNSGILNSNILKVSHHGSKTSSILEFLSLVKPQIALIGVGKNNKFGHPNKEVMVRLDNLKCRVYRTDEDGEISIIVNKDGNFKIKKMQ